MSAADAFWAGLPLGRGVTVITRDANGLVAFNKPDGLLSHPNQRGDERRSLLTANYVTDGEFFEWGDTAAPQRLWLLNRLDAATSGVILAAASAELATAIRAHFKRKQVRKLYQALVFGSSRLKFDLWRDRLTVEKRGGQIRTAVGHIPSECAMTALKSSRGEPCLTLLQLEPRTGRSHQLRVQCARRHLPIVGDQTYGNFTRNREFAKAAGTKRLFLHSLETAFDYEWRGKRHAFLARAPLPKEFEVFL